MSVYVDHLMPTLPTEKWPFRFSCHLFADSEIELERFARQLGLKRAWYQTGGALPHYDLIASKRKQAIALGAIVLSNRQVFERIQAARKAKIS